MFFTEDYAKVVWDNQVYMWEYHSDLVAEHPYSQPLVPVAGGREAHTLLPGAL